MRLFGIEINGVDYTEKCQALTVTDHTTSIGRFDARLVDTHDIIGFQTVKIYDDGKQVFQGRVRSPVKENVPSGSGMPIGGNEWTDCLKDYLTGYVSEEDETLTQFLTDVLVNSIYGIGDIDELEGTESEVMVWDTTLEFLALTFSDTCIVYLTGEELTDELTAGTYELPDSNRRCSFWSYDTKYFYIIAYDDDNNLLKYNSTNDFVTWKGWTDLSGGIDLGDDGQFGIAWCESTTRLLIVGYDGANIDCRKYSEAGGTLTQVSSDLNICVGTLECGPIFDSNGDFYFVVKDDVTDNDYELWKFVHLTNTAAEQADWAIADNDDPKYLFRGGDASDCIVVMFDDDNNDLEEWLWDNSGGTLAYVRKIADMTNDDIGFACGFQDDSDYMFLIWEEEYAAGDADLYFSSKPIGGTSWVAGVKVVDDDNYQTLNQFQLGGDNARNLYLFYLDDDGGTQAVYIVRRFEETWGNAVGVEGGVDATSGKPHCAADREALFVAWIDSDDDVHSSLFEPYGITVTNGAYSSAEDEHSFEAGKDFDSESTSGGCTLTASTDWATDGVQSLKAYTDPAPAGVQNAWGSYESLDHAELWVRANVKIGQADSMGLNDIIYLIMALNGGAPLCYGGLTDDGAGGLQWRLYMRDGAGSTTNDGGSAEVGGEYCVELHWIKDAAVGAGYLYVDGVLTCSLTNKDTADFGNCDTLYFGQMAWYRDGDTTIYLDQCAWGEDGDNRVGCTLEGWFRTENYNASGSMLNWGSLDSTDDDDANTVWSIYDGVPALIVGGLITAVDLEDAGVANTDDPIEIRADMTQGVGGARNYVYDIRLSEKQGKIDYLMDNEWCSTALKKQADILGMEFKLRWDNTVDFLNQLGEDKSDRIILLTAKSQSEYPDIIPNIIVINREPDFDSFANAVKILGSGNYPSRIEGQAQDADSQETYGVHWMPITNKDCTTVGMANTAARTQVNARKDPLERIDVRFYDDYDSGDIEIGDIVTIVDEETGLNQSARIISLTYGFNQSGRFAGASLSNRIKAKTFIEYLAKQSDLERWV